MLHTHQNVNSPLEAGLQMDLIPAKGANKGPTDGPDPSERREQGTAEEGQTGGLGMDDIGLDFDCGNVQVGEGEGETSSPSSSRRPPPSPPMQAQHANESDTAGGVGGGDGEGRSAAHKRPEMLHSMSGERVKGRGEGGKGPPKSVTGV